MLHARLFFAREHEEAPVHTRMRGPRVLRNTRRDNTRRSVCTRAGEQRARSERQNSASRGATRSLMRSLYFSGRASRQVVVSSDGK